MKKSILLFFAMLLCTALIFADILFEDGFETENGWTLTGEFEIGAPQGLGGEYGNPDPTSAFAGTNVLGSDLSGLGPNHGDYEASIPDTARYMAISPVVDCTGFVNIQLNFQGYLNVEDSRYDHALIEVTIDGTNWETIWENPSGNNNEITDSVWAEWTVDITQANNQSAVQARFVIGPTDGSWFWSGWNVDEFKVLGEIPSTPPSPVAYLTPANAVTDMFEFGTLGWEASPIATGYKLYFGTDGGGTVYPTDVADAMDLSGATSYDFTGLDYATTYYWAIAPFNVAGEAADCPIWSFTTRDNPTITTFPWTESFENNGDLPTNWLNDPNDSDQDWEFKTPSSSDHTNPVDHTFGDNSHYIAFFDDSNDPSGNASLLTPPMDISGLANPTLSFFYSIGKLDTSDSDTRLVVDIYSNGSWNNDVLEVGLAIPWTEATIDLSSYAASDVIIRFTGIEHATEYDRDIALDDVTIFSNSAVPPACNLTSPDDAATDVWFDADLGWSSATGATGYKLYLGTDGNGTATPTDILNGEDLGVAFSYNLEAQTLAFSTTYYWQVKPYNGIGEAENCPIRSFTTVPDPTVTSFPWTEEFTTWPPYGWDLEGGVEPWQHYNRVSPEVHCAKANFWGMDVAETAYLTTPEIVLPVGANLSFNWSKADFNTSYDPDSIFVDVTTDNGANWSTIWEKTDPNTFASGDGATSTAPGTFVIDYASLTQFGGNTIKIRFRAHSGYGPDFFLDNVTVFEGDIPEFGFVQGLVTNAATGDSLESAIIDFGLTEDRATTVTDENGTYSIELETGQYDVVCSAFGYDPFTTTVTVTTDATETLNFQLNALPPDNNETPATATQITLPVNAAPYAILTENDEDWYRFEAEANTAIRIFTERINGSMIDPEAWLYGPHAADGSDVVETVFIASDDDGNDDLQPLIEKLLPTAGYYYLRICYCGNDPEQPGERAVFGDYALNIEFLPGGNVEGIVTDATTSGPISGANVAWGDLVQTTDATGYYLLEDVDMGEQTLEVSAVGYNVKNVTVDVDYGETTTANVTLDEFDGELYPAENPDGMVLEFNSAGILWDAPNPMLTGTVWDAQNTEGVTFVKNAQIFGQNGANYSCMVASDFVLPIGSTITDANFFIATTPAYASPCSFDVKIYANNSGMPAGDPIHTITTNEVAPDNNSMYAVTFDTPVTLTAGTYWLAFAMNLDASTGSQANSMLRATLDNSTPGYWINPGAGYGLGTDWIAIEDESNTQLEVAYALISNPGAQTRQVVASNFNNKHKESTPVRTSGLTFTPKHGSYINPYEMRLNREYVNNDRALVGYNVYRDGNRVNTNTIEGTVFIERGLAPGTYNYTVTTVYQEGESEPTEAVALTIDPTPEFAERWDSLSFTDNNWTFEPDQGNWVIATNVGLLPPCLAFVSSADTAYSTSIMTPMLDGTELTNVTLDYNLKLDNIDLATNEFMTVEVFNGTNWTTIATHSNQTGDTPFFIVSIDISGLAAGNTFQVKFTAHGANNANINFWAIDNIGINAPEAASNGIVSGAVRDAMTLLPVDGVTITIGEYSTTTAANGSYSLEVPEGTYDVVASKDGYVDYTHPNAEVTADNTTPVNISIIPNTMPGIVIGFITNATTTQPVSGVTVSAGAVTATSDNSGAYQLDLAPGTYTINYTHPLYETYTVADLEVVPGGTHVSDAALTPLPLEFWPASNLIAENSDFKDVILSWSTISHPDHIELAHDDGYVENWWYSDPDPNETHYMGTVHTYDEDFVIRQLKVHLRSDMAAAQTCNIRVSKLDDDLSIDLSDSLFQMEYTLPAGNQDAQWAIVPCNIPLEAGTFFFVSVSIADGTDFLVAGTNLAEGDAGYSYLSMSDGNSWMDFATGQDPSELAIHAVISTGNDMTVRNARRVSSQQVKNRISTSRVLAPLVGYNIYRNNTLVNDTPLTTTMYKDRGLADGSYDYTIKAVYEEGNLSVASDAVTIVIDDPGTYYPATNFAAAIEGDTSVRLTWEAPHGAGHVWYQLDNEGRNSGYRSQVTATTEDMMAADFVLNNSTTLTSAKLMFFTNPDVSGTPQSFQIKVYQNTAANTPGPLVSTTATATATSENSIYDVTFNPPVFLGAGTYWFSAAMNAPGGGATPYWYIRPTAINGTYAYVRGATGWRILHDTQDNEDLELCFALVGSTEDRENVVVVNNMTEETLTSNINSVRRINNKTKEKFEKAINLNHVETINVDRACFGYRIYRNDTMIHEIAGWETLEYLDENLDPDMYTYRVTALYNDVTPAVESAATEDKVVMIFSPNTNPPTNFSNSFTDEPPYNATFTWAAPLPGGGDSVDVIDEGFEYGFLPGNWLNIDANADNFAWEVTQDLAPRSGQYCLASASATIGGGALMQDNYLVTPRIALGANGELRFWVAAENALRVGEFFNVWVSTGAPTVAELQANLVYSDTLESTTYEEVVIDLSAYANQTVYIAWEHCDVHNMYYMKLDDISVTSDNTTRFAEDFEGSNQVRRDSKKKIREFADRDVQEYRLYKDGHVIYSGLVTAAIDRGVHGGTHEYWVTAVYESGLESDAAETLTIVSSNPGVDDVPGLDYVTSLGNNHPNPFNPSTVITYSVKENGPVTIEIYNLKGQKVKTLVNNANHKAGKNFEQRWNGENDSDNSVSSGVYFYRMKAGRYTSTKKMILMK